MDEPRGGAEAGETPAQARDGHPPRIRRPSFLEVFRAKLPELILEAASVVFAVLLALALDEWSENRDLARVTRLAMTRVEEEVTANSRQLDEARTSLEAAAGGLDEAPTSGQPVGAQTEVSVQLNLPLLPSAAWQAAQMSQAGARLPIDWASRAAEAYELQELYETRQALTFDLLTGGGPVGADQDPDEALGRLRAQLRTLLLLLGELEKSYAEVLAAGG